MSMNPRETTEKIRADYQNYLSSILTVRDQEITRQAQDCVHRGQFLKGPYLETTLPFVNGMSLKDLVKEGLLSKEFSRVGGALHYDDWKSRSHQEIALRKCIGEERNIIVSTGTGSGKTECYLYPIFDALMKEKEAGTLGPGVRALLLFPMNALANDQQKKLRKLLHDYSDITFGRYTGETPHKETTESIMEAEARLHALYNSEHVNDGDPLLRISIPNEYMSREAMIESPPHILLTNYAMLEYLLLQPDTAPFFDSDSASNWRFLVLDEAHTYKGATGTEISFLLGRLKERIKGQMQKSFRCIATSATLGSADAKEGLAQFATKLFGEPFTAEDVITSRRVQPKKPQDAHMYSPDDYRKLNTETKEMSEEERGKRLYQALIHDTRLYHLYNALQGSPKTLEAVTEKVFPDIADRTVAEAALIDMVEIAAAAKCSLNDAALLPARYHLFLKSLEGLFVQFYPKKRVFLDRHEQHMEDDDEYYAVFELANCQSCGQEYLVGRTKKDRNGNTVLSHSGDMDHPEFYLISKDLNADEVLFDSDDETDEQAQYKNQTNKYHLCLKCGSITSFATTCHANCCEPANPDKIVTVVHIPFTGKGQDMNCCPCCGATRSGLIRRFLTANQPATFTIAKSLYDALPPCPPNHQAEALPSSSNNLIDNFFASFTSYTPSPEIVDESGRKLLIFSDNRQEAAFFAGYFEKKYRQIMWRRLILKCLRRTETQGLTIDSLIDDVAQEARKVNLYPIEITHDVYQQKKIAEQYVMYEFLCFDVSTGLEGLGYLDIAPRRIEGLPSAVPGLSSNEFWHLLRYMMDTLRQKGACNFPEQGASPSDDFFAPRNRVYSFRKENTKMGNNESILAFCPAKNHINKRSAFLEKLFLDMGRSEEDAKTDAQNLLSQIMDWFTQTRMRDILFTLLQEKSAGCRYQLNYRAWNISYLSENATIYRCRRCGQLSTYSIRNLCPSMKCNGKMEQITVGQARHSIYYRNMLESEKIIPMEAREHTAQLSSQTAAAYQSDFENGKINVLSCSTTFEMGVDVGELEATFLRNVPPETSNYIQRAGRAGRRTSSTAFSVTFARRRSHDMTFFQTPEKIIAGDIRVPSLEISNEKIAERHLNSIIIAWFFENNRQYFDGNVTAIVSSDNSFTPNMAQSLHQALQAHPQELLDRIQNALPDEVCKRLQVHQWSFINRLIGPSGSLTKAIQERETDIQNLQAYRNKLDPSKQREQRPYNAAGHLMRTLTTERSINFLSSHGVLPKYGFPVDSVNLDILYHDHGIADSIDLTRDLRIAISEFAPSAAVVANGRVWSSYSINTVPNQSWPSYIYYTCTNCHRIIPPNRGMVSVTFPISEAEPRNCPFCGENMKARKFIIPQFGFSTKIDVSPKMVGDSRPKTYYATQTQFWGLEERTELQRAEARQREALFIGTRVPLTYSPGGQLFVLNQGNNHRGFLTCPDCGYTIDATQIQHNQNHKVIQNHRTKYNEVCFSRLLHVSLGHRFATDILKITLPVHRVIKDDYQEKDQTASVLYAILEGASTKLDISRDDINGCINFTAGGEQELILFDHTPGGSGFVKQIYENFEQVVLEAINQVSGVCGCSPETSCYGCLRNYANQTFHESLSRGLAHDYLTWLVHAPAHLDFTEATSSSNTTTAVRTQKCITNSFADRRSSHYSISSTDLQKSTILALQECLDSCEESICEKNLRRLISLANGKQLEPAMLDSPIPVDGRNIWPSIFWPNTRVALFEMDALGMDQYEILRTFDWHCYLLDETFDAEAVINLIQE